MDREMSPEEELRARQRAFEEKARRERLEKSIEGAEKFPARLLELVERKHDERIARLEAELAQAKAERKALRSARQLRFTVSANPFSITTVQPNHAGQLATRDYKCDFGSTCHTIERLSTLTKNSRDAIEHALSSGKLRIDAARDNETDIVQGFKRRSHSVNLVLQGG